MILTPRSTLRRTCQIALAALGSICLVAHAQDWARPLLPNLQRLDLRELGYPQVNEIPVNSTAITALCAARDGRVYGGTSGESAYLFVFEPTTNKVRHLGKIRGAEGIHHALVEDAQGRIYLGAGRSVLDEVPLSAGKPGEAKLDELLWRDIQAHFQDYAGGHLLRFDPKRGSAQVKLPDMDAELVDLGMPAAKNSIYALTTNVAGTEIYGLTYPDGRFFVYNIASGKFTDVGPVDEERVFHGPERHWRSLPRALVCDNAGRVFTSGTRGELIYYCPKTRKLQTTGLRVPGDYVYVQFFTDHAVVECFARSPAGKIYGGTCDGYSCAFDPAAMKLVNLGKPRAARRLRCLTVGNDGRVYCMAGERSAARPCQAYCYDPRSGGFTDLGLLIVDRSPHYYWRGYQFDAMATGQDGTIYFGESERRSHLFLFMP
jgi:hypothetical protein